MATEPEVRFDENGLTIFDRDLQGVVRQRWGSNHSMFHEVARFAVDDVQSPPVTTPNDPVYGSGPFGDNQFFVTDINLASIPLACTLADGRIRVRVQGDSFLVQSVWYPANGAVTVNEVIGTDWGDWFWQNNQLQPSSYVASQNGAVAVRQTLQLVAEGGWLKARISHFRLQAALASNPISFPQFTFDVHCIVGAWNGVG
ncbi:MAG: hypothetical protein AAF737_04705 [Pseudomonadota bacterium]